MNKKVFIPLLMGILISTGSGLAQEPVANVISQKNLEEHQAPQKIRLSQISIQWTFEAETTKEGLEKNSTYLAKVQEITKKYKIELKEISNSFSIETLQKDQGDPKEKVSKEKVRMYYVISTSFETNASPVNAIVADMDALNYASFSYNEIDGYREQSN